MARVYTGDTASVAETLIKANQHKGISVIEALQPCVTYNKICDHAYYQENTYNLGEDYNANNKEAALQKALEWGPKQIPLGMIYQASRPTYESNLTQIKDKPLVSQPVVKRDITGLIS